MIEEEVVYPNVPCPYFCEEAFKVINTIFAAIMDINEFALSDIVGVGGQLFD